MYLYCLLCRKGAGHCKFPPLPANAMWSFVSKRHWRELEKEVVLLVPECSAWQTRVVHAPSPCQGPAACGSPKCPTASSSTLAPLHSLLLPVRCFPVNSFPSTLVWFSSEFWSMAPPSDRFPQHPRSQISSKFASPTFPQPSAVGSGSQSGGAASSKGDSGCSLCLLFPDSLAFSVLCY